MSNRTPSSTLPGTPAEKEITKDEEAGIPDTLTQPSGKLDSSSHDDGSKLAEHAATAVHGGEADADFEVRFSGDNDPLSPKSISLARKWIAVIVVSTTSLCVACVSSVYAETYGQVTKEFECSNLVATLGLSSFVFGLGLSPMLLAPLSEFYGRKPVYTFSLIFFTIWIIPCAVAQNIQTMIVVRFFDGFSGSAFLSVAGSTVGDMFTRDRLALPMAVYTLSPFLGPQLGPLLGGFINYYLNWRWTFWVVLIWAACQTAAVLLLVPETYAPVLIRNEARRRRRESGDARWWAPLERLDRSVAQTVLRSCYRPFLLLALEPMCLNLCLYCSLLLGILYLFFGAFNIVFTDNHGFNLWQAGLTFLGLTVGMILGTCSNFIWNKNYRRLVARHAARHGDSATPEPEFRLPPAIAGAVLVTIGLLWFGWTTYPSIHWMVPIAGSALFGAGVILTFSGVWTFLVESYPTFAASALAANAFARSCFATTFPLFGDIMYHRLGDQWATFLLAMISLVMLPFPFIFYKYGSWFRARSRYAGAR